MIEDLGADQKAVQRRAAEAMAQCARVDPLVITRLEALLGEESWRQRWGAVFALSLAGAVPSSALPTLIEALDDDDGDVRWAAAGLVNQLGQRDPSIVLPALLHAARVGRVNQRKMSLYVLRDLRLQEGAGVAADGLEAAATEVRLAALSAFVVLAPDKLAAAERVILLVDDADARIRRTATVCLGELAVITDAVLDVLDRASKSDDPSLQRAANRALLRIRRPIP
jgi:HEAT repeat protein